MLRQDWWKFSRSVSGLCFFDVEKRRQNSEVTEVASDLSQGTLFFVGNTFINNTRLKFVKYLAKVKQHLEANFCYMKIIRFLLPKIIGDILKNMQKRSPSVLSTLYD